MSARSMKASMSMVRAAAGVSCSNSASVTVTYSPDGSS